MAMRPATARKTRNEPTDRSVAPISSGSPTRNHGSAVANDPRNIGLGPEIERNADYGTALRLVMRKLRTFEDLMYIPEDRSLANARPPARRTGVLQSRRLPTYAYTR